MPCSRYFPVFALCLLCTTTSAQAPSAPAPAKPVAAPAPAPVRLTGRSGIAIVAVPTPTPAAVVQLRVTVPAGFNAEDRPNLTAFAQALAEGRLNPNRPSLRTTLATLGGETRVHVDADQIVVSMAVPERHLANALAFVDARLAGRRKLQLATAPVPRMGVSARIGRPRGPVPREVLQLWAPNHPYHRSLTRPAPSPATRADVVRAADSLLRRGLVEVVVASGETRRALAVLVDRHLRTRLPSATNAVLPPVLPLPGTHALELAAPVGAPGSIAIYLPLQPAATAKEWAVRVVIAMHLGGVYLEQTSGALLMYAETLPTPAQAGAVEVKLLKQLEAIAGLSPSAFDRAKASAKTNVAAGSRTVHGQTYWLAANPIAAQLTQLDAVTRSDVTDGITTLRRAPRIVAKEVIR